MPPTFDLQSHSIHSDGALPAADVVARAAAAGVELLALTDHDTIDGVAEARAAAREHGIAFIPAAELSAVHGAHEDLHILGYEIDDADADLQGRAARLPRRPRAADRRDGRPAARARLRARRRAAGGAPRGRQADRPPAPRRRRARPPGQRRSACADEGIDGRDALFPPYLIPGAAAYVARSRPTVAQAIEVIHAAGGVAVWAHPFWDLDHVDEALATLDAFAAAGLDGVEAFYATHGAEQTRCCTRRPRERGLLTTGSADFHGPQHERFNAFRAFELYGLEPNLGPIGAQSWATTSNSRSWASAR